MNYPPITCSTQENGAGNIAVVYPLSYVAVAFPLKAGQPGRQVLLLFFYVYVLGVDYAFVFLGFRGWFAGGWLAFCGGGAGCGVGFVEDFGHLVRGGGQLLLLGLELCRRGVAFEGLAGVGEGGFYLGTLRALDLVAGFLQHLFDVVGGAVEELRASI